MEVLQPNQAETQSIIQASKLSGHGYPARSGCQPSALQAEWWPTYGCRESSASDLAGAALGPSIGGSFIESGSALGYLRLGGPRRCCGRFTSLAKPNKLLQLDTGFAGAAEQGR